LSCRNKCNEAAPKASTAGPSKYRYRAYRRHKPLQFARPQSPGLIAWAMRIQFFFYLFSPVLFFLKKHTKNTPQQPSSQPSNVNLPDAAAGSAAEQHEPGRGKRWSRGTTGFACATHDDHVASLSCKLLLAVSSLDRVNWCWFLRNMFAV
jgi:hypothetical protein